jgi:hypothetical protein
MLEYALSWAKTDPEYWQLEGERRALILINDHSDRSPSTVHEGTYVYTSMARVHIPGIVKPTNPLCKMLRQLFPPYTGYTVKVATPDDLLVVGAAGSKGDRYQLDSVLTYGPNGYGSQEHNATLTATIRDDPLRLLRETSVHTPDVKPPLRRSQWSPEAQVEFWLMDKISDLVVNLEFEERARAATTAREAAARTPSAPAIPSVPAPAVVEASPLPPVIPSAPAPAGANRPPLSPRQPANCDSVMDSTTSPTAVGSKRPRESPSNESKDEGDENGESLASREADNEEAKAKRWQQSAEGLALLEWVRQDQIAQAQASDSEGD